MIEVGGIVYNYYDVREYENLSDSWPLPKGYYEVVAINEPDYSIKLGKNTRSVILKNIGRVIGQPDRADERCHFDIARFSPKPTDKKRVKNKPFRPGTG